MDVKCQNCTHPSKACISYLMTLTTRDTLDWCRMWAKRLGWSNAFLAERSGVPKGTIDRSFSIAKNDGAVGVKLATIRPIICALTGCTLQELEACHDSDHHEVVALREKNKELAESVSRMKEDSTLQHSFLTNQIKLKDRYIAILSGALLVAVVIIIAALCIDNMNPNVGFFWVDR